MAQCHRCGKKHLARSGWKYLELDTYTSLFSDPAVTDVSTDRSQGLFKFGLHCAERVLANGGKLIKKR